MNKCALDVIKEMTEKIKNSLGKTTVTEKRYTYSNDEVKTIFTNIFNSIEEYTTKNPEEGAYETLLNSISDRFKTSTLGGDISRQVDRLSSAEDLFNKQPEFQEMLDNAKDLVTFIREKTEKSTGTGVPTTTEVVTKVPDEDINKQ